MRADIDESPMTNDKANRDGEKSSPLLDKITNNSFFIFSKRPLAELVQFPFVLDAQAINTQEFCNLASCYACTDTVDGEQVNG